MKKILQILILLVIFLSIGQATVKTWTNGGATGNWSDASNWDPNGVPNNGDVVIFNGTSTDDCNVNVTTNSLANFTMDFDYIGTVHLYANLNVNYSNASFIITNGTFNASSYVITVSGNWDSFSSSATFTRGISTVNLTGTGTVLMGSSSQGDYTHAFHNVVIKEGTTRTSVGSSGHQTKLTGLFMVNGTALGTSSASWFHRSNLTNPIIFGPSGSLRGYVTGHQANWTLPPQNGSYTYLGLEFGGGYKATLTGNVVAAVGFFGWTGHGSSGDTILDTNGYNFTVTGGLPMGYPGRNAILLTNGSTININGKLEIKTSGAYIDFGSSSWTINGNWNSTSTSSNWNAGTANVTFNGTNQNISVAQTSPANFYNLFIKNNANVTLDSNVNLSGSFGDGADNGTLNMQSYTMYVGENWDSSSTALTFNRGTSTVELTGTGNLTASPDDQHSFYNLKVAAGSETTTIIENSWVSGVLTIGTGTLNKLGPSRGIRMRGSLTDPLVNNGGTITDAYLQFWPTIDYNIPGGTNYYELYIGGGDDYRIATLQGNIQTSGLVKIDRNGRLNTTNYNMTIGASFQVGYNDNYYSYVDCGSSVINVGTFVSIKANSYILGNTSTWAVSGYWESSSNSPNINMGTSNITFNGTTQSINVTNISHANFYNIFIKDGANVTLVSNVNLSGSFGGGANNGTFNPQSYTMYVGGDWNSSSTDLNFSRGTSTVDLYGTGTLSCATSGDFYNLNVGAAGQTTTVVTDCGVTDGQLTLGTGTIDQTGGTRNLVMGGSQVDPLINNGATMIGTLTLYFNLDNDYNIPAGTNYRRITATGVNLRRTATLQGDITASRLTVYRRNHLNTANYDIAVSELTVGVSTYESYLEAGSSTIDTSTVSVTVNSFIHGNTSNWYVRGDWSSSSTSSSMDMGISNVTFNGTTQSISVASITPANFYNIFIKNNASVTLNSDLNLSGSFGDGADNGTLNMQSYTMYVGTNWNSSSSSLNFSRGTSTVNLYGTGTIASRSGNSFYNLNVGAAGQTTTVVTDCGVTDGQLTLGTGTLTQTGGTRSISMTGSQTDPFVNGGGSMVITLVFTPSTDYNIPAGTNYHRITIDSVTIYKLATLQGNIKLASNLFIAWGGTLNTANYNITTGPFTIGASIYANYIEAGSSIINATSSVSIAQNGYILGNTSTWYVGGNWNSYSTSSNWDPGTSKIIFDSGTQQNVIITNATATPFYDVEVGNGTVLYLKNDTQMRSINVTNGTELRIDAVSEAKNLTLYFSDLSGAGFKSGGWSDYYGDLTTIGNWTYRVKIRSNATGIPSNLWAIPNGAGVTLNLSYTSFNYHKTVWMRSNQNDILNCTFSTTTVVGAVFFIGQPVRFENVTIDVGYTGIGTQTNIYNLNNVIILNSFYRDVSVTNANSRLEFNNSNFNTSKVVFSASGTAAVISQNHNDVANDYKIWIEQSSSRLKSTITNDFGVNDNVEILNGTFVLDENATARTILLNESATLQVGEDAPTKSVKLEFADVSGAGFNTSSSGTLKATGTATYPMHITSVNEPPTNYWLGPNAVVGSGFNMTHTSINYYIYWAARGAICRAVNVNFENAGPSGGYALGRLRDCSSDSELTNVTITGNKDYAMYKTGNPATITNMNISGGTWTTDFRLSGKTEFIDSNFNISDIDWLGTAKVVSKNHNDIVNDYKINMEPSATLSKSEIINDFSSLDNVEIISGTLVLDENGQSSNFTIDSGASAYFNSSSFNLKSGNNMILINGNLTMNQSTIDFGNNTYGLYINYSNTSIWSSTIFNSSGWDIYLNDSNISATDLSFGGATTTFHARDVAIRNATNPPSTSGYTNVSSFLNITNTSGSSWINLNVSYTGTPSGESSLKMYKYTGGSWSVLSNTGVDTTRKVVWATDITSFSIFAPLSQVSGNGGGIGPSRPAISGPAPEMGPTQGMEKFETDLSFIEVVLNLGESLDKPLTVINTGTRDLSITMDKGELGNYVTLPSSFTLNINGSKIIKFNFYGPELGIKTGIIRIQSDRFVKEVPVVIEVETDMTLFDAKIDIIPEYKEVNAGEDLKAQVSLFRIGPAERMVDVIVTYLIKDLEDNVISTESETFAVLDQVSYTKEFEVPSSLSSGTYVVAIEVMYGSSFATSSAMFVVKGIGLMPLGLMDIVGLILLIVSIVGLITYFKFWKKKKDTSPKSTRRRKFINTD